MLTSEIHATPAVQQILKEKIDETHELCKADLSKRDWLWAKKYLDLTKKQEFMFDWLRKLALNRQREMAA
ncbi:MAG: hypothetical protein LBH81_02870 [Rickettsiales bacterium]|jgi:hypothetical protein|nr:hypothetical protein [Rickettsiales bacterium]